MTSLLFCWFAVSDGQLLSRTSYGSDDAVPRLIPDCSALEPPLCTNTHSTDPETGEYTWDYYLVWVWQFSYIKICSFPAEVARCKILV